MARGYSGSSDNTLYTVAQLIERLQTLPPSATVHITGSLEDRPVEPNRNFEYDAAENTVTFSGDVVIAN